MSEAWMDAALCAQTDPDAFFLEVGEEGKAAKRVCGACPVREMCLEYALRTRPEWGIWAGLNHTVIAKMRKEMV